MPVEKYSISLQLDTAQAVALRQESDRDRSTIINRSLGRYFWLLDQARRRLAAELSDGEIGLILDALNGTMFAEPFSIQIVPVEIEDALPDGLAEKWEVDGPALVKKLEAMDYWHLVALVDAVERWWNRVAAGEQPAPAEALKK
jgi:hypothetical protein